MAEMILAAVGAFTVAKWLRERWRTRNDKGYPWLMPAITRPQRCIGGSE